MPRPICPKTLAHYGMLSMKDKGVAHLALEGTFVPGPEVVKLFFHAQLNKA